MTSLRQLIDAMETIAPTRYAEAWDNVGLLAGDPDQPVSKALLTIDYTPEVAREAEAGGFGAIIAYHPPIFDAIKRITADSLIFDAIRRGCRDLFPAHRARRRAWRDERHARRCDRHRRRSAGTVASG
jgi:putative NIF3 family GTP cyclohydrolase 1 type 2